MDCARENGFNIDLALTKAGNIFIGIWHNKIELAMSLRSELFGFITGLR